jgi:hypothetical protein
MHLDKVRDAMRDIRLTMEKVLRGPRIFEHPDRYSDLMHVYPPGRHGMFAHPTYHSMLKSWTTPAKNMETLEARLWSAVGWRRPTKRSETYASHIVELRFKLNWNISHWISRLGLSLDSDIWNRILCLTGSCQNAQASTVAEYFHQTWPATGEFLLKLLLDGMRFDKSHGCLSNLGSSLNHLPIEEFGSVPEARLSVHTYPNGSCSISAIGSTWFVSDVATQLAWLTTAHQISPQCEKLVELAPRISALAMISAISNTWEVAFYTVQDITNFESPNGSCWTRLPLNAIMVSGYPIPARTKPSTGLEISLKAMACVIRSTQIVRFDHRLIMKGFNVLLVATAFLEGEVLWHAMTSSTVDERVSYFDARIDELNFSHDAKSSLHGLEHARHFVGWCSQAADFCGKC